MSAKDGPEPILIWRNPLVISGTYIWTAKICIGDALSVLTSRKNGRVTKAGSWGLEI
jgi:hypothetical protein